MAKEYIEREAAKRAIMSQYLSRANKTKYADVIDAVPAADVVEVRRGRWMCECFDPVKYGDFKYHAEEYTGQSHKVCGRPYCSSCAEDIPLNGGENYWITRFCPNCGARMDGDGE